MAVDARIDREATHRLIPTKYSRTGSVLEKLNLPAEVLADLSTLDAATNQRIVAEQGDNPGIGPAELLFAVPEAAIVNAAFTHRTPYGGRFNDERRNAWYAGFELRTSLAEVAYHKQQFLRHIGEVEPRHYDYQDFLADFHGIFSELTTVERATCLRPEPIPECYGPGQSLARSLLSEGKAGLVYPSVRDQPNGMCIVCFRPALVLNPRRGQQYRLTIGSSTPWTPAEAQPIHTA